MKTPLIVLTVTAACLALLWWLGPQPDPTSEQTRTDLPWQVTTSADGTSRVFDLHLGEATLADATQKFGSYENMAVFVSNAGTKSLEAYFGSVQFGPLTAKIVATLEASDAELDNLVANARERVGSPSGDWKFMLEHAVNKAQEPRRIQSISYVPGYAGLDADFFRQRLGEPAAWKTLDKHTVQWFYPQRGLSLVLNARGKEVLEYRAPHSFVIPADVEGPTRHGQ